MAGKLQFTLQEYKDAARKWRSDFLRLPIIGCDETLKFMTGRPGIRYKESVGTLNASAQFAPYSPTRSEDVNLQLDFRTLETFFGSVVAKFEPNSAISTLLGTGATKGDGQKSVPTAREVLGLIAKSLSEKLNDAIWSGVRNASGTTTQDLFDGFDTITKKEVTSGALAKENGNYLKLTDAITSANAVTWLRKSSSRLILVFARRRSSCTARRTSWISITRVIFSHTAVFHTTRNTISLLSRVLTASSSSVRLLTRRTRSISTSHQRSICFMDMTRWATWNLLTLSVSMRSFSRTSPPCSSVYSSSLSTSDA